MRKLILLALFVLLVIPNLPVNASGQALPVYFAGVDGGLRTALSLDKDVVLVTDPSLADVYVLNGVIPPGDSAIIRDRIKAGAGLILVLGPGLTAQAIEDLLAGQIQLEKQTTPLSLEAVKGNPDGLLKNILWSSAP